MKIKKGDKIYPVITGEDVIATKGYSVENDLTSFPTVDDILDKHQKDLDKLKSNMKYIYSYGGVGGNGSGGSGGTTTEKEPSLYITLDGHQLQAGGNAIVLSEPGEYIVEGNVRNSGGKTYYIRVVCGTDINLAKYTKLDETNQCKYKQSFNLKTNDKIKVLFYNEDYETLLNIEQQYVVNPHSFDVKFKYKYDGGKQESEFTSSNEYFIGDSTKSDPFIDISFKIDIPNVSGVSVEYSIGDTDKNNTDKTKSGQETYSYGTTTDISNDHLIVYLDDLTRNGDVFLDAKNTGVYKVVTKLTYSVYGESVVSEVSFSITIIPNYLYINVRNPENVIYDTLDELVAAMKTGEDSIPEKSVYVGSYVSFYYKVYEGNIISGRTSYDVNFEAYNGTSEKDTPYDFTFGDEPSIYSNDYNITVQEQVENANPVSVPFDTTGVKKLVFKTNSSKYDTTTGNTPTIKYIYIKPKSSTLDWYPQQTGMSYEYFRANQGENTYSSNFPKFSTGNSPFVMKSTDTVFTLEDNLYKNKTSDVNATVLSLGMQYSSVNKDSSDILKIYSPKGDGGGGYYANPDINLRSDKLFSDLSSQKAILIPYEEDYKPSDSSKYHLIQIVRKKLGFDANQTPQYATYLYIDGILESNDQSLSSTPWTIGKFEFNNVNVSYNLIEVDYMDNIDNIDGFIYQYYLKYKETVQQQDLSVIEQTVLEQINSIKFDGKDVIVNKSLVETLAPQMPIPTMLIDFNNIGDDNIIKLTDDEISALKENLFKGYPNGDTSFGNKDVSLYWSDGLKDGNSNSLKKITIPNITTDEGVSLSGNWNVSLQGTSTMRNKIKNFSLKIQTTTTTETTNKDYILTSPNFDANDGDTFLPEREWTLKADIADSAHANNTSIGKFVNKVCTDFETGLNLDTDIKKYIKNTLEGFPILMFVWIGQSVYYLGVYNFNLGRSSYYNLGYNTKEDIEKMFGTISHDSGSSFVFAYGTNTPNPDLAIGEIQDNFAGFDFHQYDRSVLFAPDNSSRTRMFGKSSKLTYTNLSRAQDTLYNFVKSIATAGAYCFEKIGKNPVSSQADSGLECVDRYDVVNQVPDVKYQYKYNNDNDDEIVWYENTDLTFDKVKNDPDNLLRCISTTLTEDKENEDGPLLDYTSASEYYVICMIFGMVDSILKNMNIKSWNGKKCFVAFYDMDCANGENNAGGEDVSYLAATDYWHSDENTSGYTQTVSIDYDYWDNEIGKGFDFKSSYLFAIVKYAQSILNMLGISIRLTHYPQDFWAELRKKDGELRDADHFIDDYFVSGIGKIPTYLASLNYQVKYLYKGKTLDSDTGEESTEDTYLANGTAFNGSRIFKVRNWLKKRIHFLDAMFNVQGMSLQIAPDIYVPIPTNLNDLTSNSDVVLLTDAFSTGTKSRILSANNALPVKITAPLNTPLVISRGTDYMMYLLAGEDNENTIQLTTQLDVSTRFLGSKSFTNVSAIEPFLTDAYQIVSDNIEEIIYGGSSFAKKNNALNITSSSVKKIKLNMSTFSGKLTITNTGLYGQSLNSLDVSNSGFYGEWTNLASLQSLNISSLNCTSNESISISGAELLTGDNCIISGTNENHTKLPTLTIKRVSGNFKLQNTDIQVLDLSIIDGEEGTFEINGDESLTQLTLEGFKSIKISGCSKLNTLKIVEGEKNKCESIIIDMPYTYDDKTKDDLGTLTKFKSDTVGIFDFSSYTALDTLGLSGLPAMTVVKIPNRKVKIDTLKNNINLEFVDTPGKDSCISLTNSHTFFGSPKYGMRQSWKMESSSRTAYTHMCIDKSCTSLAYTFGKNISLSSNYLNDSANPYTNTWGQEVYNYPITLTEAGWFINTVVAGEKWTYNYIKEDDSSDGVSYESLGISYGEDRRSNITTLSGCFRQQKEISLEVNTVFGTTCPDLSKFTSLEDISTMYYDTNVTCLCKEVLSLPDENNTIDHPLDWTEVIKMGDIKMAKDAFIHISYRITGLSNMSITLYEWNETSNNYSTKVSGTTLFTDVLCPKKNGDNNLDLMGYFSTVIINSTQEIDYTGTFDLCPEIKSLSGFLNGDLSKSKITDLLKTNTTILRINDSFSHTGDVSSLETIDLYDFFNWKNTDMETLFISGNSTDVGFRLNKTISYEHLKEILDLLPKYKEITYLCNLFSYCTITNYNNEEIVLGDKMSSIITIKSLFYNCKAENSSGESVPLNIGRSFFEKLPNVQIVSNTFYGVYFSKFPTYDFFAKRRTKTENVYVKIDDVYTSASLNTYSYPVEDNRITSLANCFKNARFVNCKCWFDPDTDENKSLKPSVVVCNGEEYDTYYKYENEQYVEYKTTEMNEVLDTKNNFTNYVEQITISIKGVSINNHKISTDLTNWNNGDFNLTSKFDIVKTYCCLPPDIFYGCHYRCDLTGVFANTNILGVIPQHLVSKCYDGTFKDMLLNTNILPNVIYFYNKYLNDNKESYLELIKDIELDDATIETKKNTNDEQVYVLTTDDEFVLFRNTDGILKKRHARTGDDRSDETEIKKNTDYSHAQFAYVPQNYTTNSNLNGAFNFRYNLPAQIDLNETSLNTNYWINWSKGNYPYDTHNPEQIPEKWPYYTQYFFMTNESVDWSKLLNFSYPFIPNNNDVDYSNGNVRNFSSGSELYGTLNLWWGQREDITRSSWHSYTNGHFNVFLNLCGERDTRTGVMTDCGCLVSKSLNKLATKLDSVVSGTLGIFLNGKVFDDGVDGANLTSMNTNGEESIVFTGFGRNIRLPKFSSNDKKASKVVLESGDNSLFYDFMFDSNSKENYRTVFFGESKTYADSPTNDSGVSESSSLTSAGLLLINGTKYYVS